MAYPSLAVALIVVSVVFPVLAIAAVGLRLHARHITAVKLNVSDYFILFTLFTAILGGIATIVGGTGGVAVPFDELTLAQKELIMKMFFATQFFYIFSIWGVKVSTLSFYKSIFPTPTFIRIANGVLIVLSGWIIAFFFVTLFQDNPIDRNWGTVGTTVNWRILYVVEVATDLALDIFILCMPLPILYRLRIDRAKKWMLVTVFLLGAIIIIASTARLYFFVVVLQQYALIGGPVDFSTAAVWDIIWGTIEPCTSIVAACIPLMSPIFFRKQLWSRGRSGPLSATYEGPSGSSHSPGVHLSTRGADRGYHSLHHNPHLSWYRSEQASPVSMNHLARASAGDSKMEPVKTHVGRNHSHDPEMEAEDPNYIHVYREVIVEPKRNT